jgi:hypothetical protein
MCRQRVSEFRLPRRMRRAKAKSATAYRCGGFTASLIANNRSQDALVSLLNRHTVPAMLRATGKGRSGSLQPV